MPTFIVLPPRELIEHAVHEFAARLLPGFPAPSGLWERFVDEMIRSFEPVASGAVFVLHREDLSDGSVSESLIDGFGAQHGDHVIEIDTPRPFGPGAIRRWTISGVRQTVKMV